MAIGRSTRRWGPILGLLLVACRGSVPADAVGGPPYVLSIDASAVSSAGSFDGRGQAAWIHDVVAAEVARAHHFRAEGEGPVLEARLRYEQRTVDEEVPVLRAHLVVEPDAALAADLDAIGMALDAYVELERRDRTIDLRRDLPVAVERALALVGAKLTLARGSTEAVGALLHDPDPEIVLLGLEGVQRRRLRALGDEVHALLGHEQERVALQAVECLGVVGGPEHTAGLLRAARLADRAHANRLYEALGNLGGEQARGFLEFAARNEQDPELAERVQWALAHLDETEPGGSSGVSVERGHRQ